MTAIHKNIVQDILQLPNSLKASEGQIKCEVVEGFEIPIRAIFDAEENLRMLREILNK